MKVLTPVETLFRRGTWVPSFGNLIRVHLKGTGECIVGVHRMKKRFGADAAEDVAGRVALAVAAVPDMLEDLALAAEHFRSRQRFAQTDLSPEGRAMELTNRLWAERLEATLQRATGEVRSC